MESFIRLENTFEKAMHYDAPPDIQFYSFSGIQLLPNNQFPYLQTTKNDDGVELEDFTEINVRSMCGELLANIADYFEVADNFQDPDTGLPQITWKILPNVPYDFGKQLVYLEVKQLVGEMFYSSPFMFTADGAELTSRVDYRNSKNDTMQSVQLNMWFYDFNTIKEYSQYWEVSTKNTQTNTIKSQKTKIYLTDISDKKILEKIVDVFDFRFTYLDFKRSSIFEPAALPEREGNENFGEMKIVFTFNESDIYNPNYVEPVPPAPPIDAPKIIFTDAQKTETPGRLNMFFNVLNLVPSYMTVQYSYDGITWVSNTGGWSSPREIVLPFSENLAGSPYTLRVYYNGTDTKSNIGNVYKNKNFWLVIQEKISETQYRITLRYNILFPSSPDVNVFFQGVYYTYPNIGKVERVINAVEGDEIEIFVTQNGINEINEITLQ